MEKILGLKRGKFSTEEEKVIRDNIAAGYSFDAIAKVLRRTPKTIKKYCVKHHLVHKGMEEDVYEDTLLLEKLEERPYWQEVKKQFAEVDLNYFAQTWIRMMKQFREDILYSEEMQVKQWITLDLMGNKVMKDRRATEEQISRLSELLEREYGIPIEDRDIEVIARLESEISLLRNSQSSYTTEHSKILDRIEKIQKDLKAARADRVKKIEDSKSSWSGFLKSLEEEDNRKRIGEELEINKIGKDSAIKRLSAYHKYDNGEIDQPLLTPENAKDD